MNGDEPGDVGNALGLDLGPAGLPDIGSRLLEVSLGKFASPVGLDSLFDFTVGTYEEESSKIRDVSRHQKRRKRTDRYGGNREH